MELNKRLEHFEQHQLDEGDEYGAEVLHHARERIAQLEAENERSPSIKVSDGDVWLVFPNAMISIEGICKFGRPGPIVRRQIREWRDSWLVKALGGE